MSPTVRQPRAHALQFLIAVCVCVPVFTIISLWWLPGGEVSQANIDETKPSNDVARLFANVSFEKAFPNTRAEQCKRTSHEMFSLPKASVIMYVNNDTASLLVTSMENLIDRTPPAILLEIIIVCDVAKLKLPPKLPNYVYQQTKVTVFLSLWHLGTSKARVVGAKRASGDVLVFLDPNTKVDDGWLEPILYEINSNRNAIVQPLIYRIDSKTHKFQKHSNDMEGQLSWKLELSYVSITKDRITARKNLQPYSVVAISGECFAVNRTHFLDIGSLDTAIHSGSGEYIELSIRAWLCGGNLKTVPCSRVAHVLRKSSSKNSLDRWHSSQRIAETWLEHYKKYYYFANEGRVIPSEDFANSEMNRIKLKLKCRNFGWFIESVSPQLKLSSSSMLYHGKLQNVRSSACVGIDDSELTSDNGIRLHMKPCLSDEAKHFVFGNNRLMFDGLCAMFDSERYAVLVSCNSVPHTPYIWVYDSGQLHWSDENSGCAMHVTDPDEESDARQTVMLMPCDHEQITFSMWRFQFEIS